jgi:enoyl-[acyl-carrier protein] reductase II
MTVTQPVGQPNRVADLLGIEIPIIQAPMTYIAGAQLASAVSNAGAMGIIETASPAGRADLGRIRTLTDKPVGANLNLLFMRDPAIIDQLLAAGIRFVLTSAGSPAVFTQHLKDAGIVVFHVVGSLRTAMKAVDAGVDGLVVEGVEGGGFKDVHGASTLVLLPLVASHVSVPIVAAGGICDARSMAAAFVLGAEAVQLGTRMLASAESPVHDNFKQAILTANETGTMLLSTPGMPTMRVIRTDLAEQTAVTGDSAGGLKRIDELYFDGDMTASLANTGQVAGRITTVQPVAEIVSEMWSGCTEVLTQARQRLGAGAPVRSEPRVSE